MTDQFIETKCYDQAMCNLEELAGKSIKNLKEKPSGALLDIGCGDGRLTELLIGYGFDVTAIDKMPDMVSLCKSRNINAFQADISDITFDEQFDVAFSNAALHWVSDHTSALKNIHNALKPDGRFIAEFGGYGDLSLVQTTILDVVKAHNFDVGKSPWFNPTAAEYTELLDSTGFTEIDTTYLFPFSYPLPNGLNTYAYLALLIKRLV